MKTAGVVLAAGASRRLGQPKQLAEVGGERLVERAIRACMEAQLEPLIVVLGADAEVVAAACEFEDARVVVNEGWQEGMASSVRCGIGALAPEDADAAIVLTCDMPFVTGEHLRALATLAEETGQNAASWYGGKRGIPVCFLRNSFDALMKLSGDTGGKALLADAPVVELAESSDVDTREQLREAQERAAGITS